MAVLHLQYRATVGELPFCRTESAVPRDQQAYFYMTQPQARPFNSLLTKMEAFLVMRNLVEMARDYTSFVARVTVQHNSCFVKSMNAAVEYCCQMLLACRSPLEE